MIKLKRVSKECGGDVEALEQCLSPRALQPISCLLLRYKLRLLLRVAAHCRPRSFLLLLCQDLFCLLLLMLLLLRGLVLLLQCQLLGLGSLRGLLGY